MRQSLRTGTSASAKRLDMSTTASAESSEPFAKKSRKSRRDVMLSEFCVVNSGNVVQIIFLNHACF